MSPRRNLWTFDEERIAKELLDSGAKNSVFLQRLGRTGAAAYTRLHCKETGGRPNRKPRASKAGLNGPTVSSSARPSQELI